MVFEIEEKTMKVKKVLVALSAFLVIQSQALQASGIPTVDAAAIAQMVLELQELQKAYQMYTQQLDSLKSTYNNFTGSRGLGMLNYDSQLRQFMPDNFQSQMQSVLQNGVSAMSSKAKDIYTSMKLGEYCDSLGESQRTLCQKEQASFAEYQANILMAKDRALQRLSTIETLMNEINHATDMKSISDLQARIDSEVASLKAAEYVSRTQQAAMERQMQKAMQIEAQKEIANSMATPSDDRFAELLRWK